MSRLEAWSGFVPVVASHELRRAAVRVTFDGTAIALYRDASGRAAALLDRCPHRFAPLSGGRIRDDGRLACPYHGWNFDHEGNGRSPSEPERTDCNTVSFRVREQGGILYVAPPGTGDSVPLPAGRQRPEGEWITRPIEPLLPGLGSLGGSLGGAIGFGRSRAGELRLARMAPSMPGPPRYRAYRVTRREQDTDAITSFTFAPVDPRAHAVPPFRAGQHVSLQVVSTSHARPLTRSYSLSDAPNGESLRVSVKRLDGTPAGLVSSHLHASLSVDSRVLLGDPRGDFVLPEDDRPLVLVAGGVGITPLFAMLRAASGRSAPITLLYGVRYEHEIYRESELLALGARQNVSVRIFVSSTGARIDEAAIRDATSGGDPDLFVCGPAPMIDDVLAHAARLGLPSARVHHERFRAAQSPEVAALAPCEVTFARTGRVLRWSPNEGSLLELAHKNGIELDSGCQVGSCGTCRVAVSRGETLESGNVRDGARASGCLVCVSVPRGDVVLDA